MSEFTCDVRCRHWKQRERCKERSDYFPCKAVHVAIYFSEKKTPNKPDWPFIMLVDNFTYQNSFPFFYLSFINITPLGSIL